MGDQTHEATEVGELVRRAADDNDEDAWSALLDRFSGLVWMIVRTHPLSFHDAQDITQTVLCNLAENLDRLREPHRVGAWLRVVTRNECLRHLQRSTQSRPFAPQDLEVADHRSPETIHLLEEGADRVRAALERLRPPDRYVARLDARDPGLAAAEVARRTGIAEGDVTRIRRRARRRLLRLLAEEEQG
ncbi:RNA polymerase sigma factor [Nocardiopsis ansamitocini]|uniref:RNA polymerase sigma factor n=1 Tax=Nocardiopsis ansamitocini TaxID=1670832 RepID=UPI002556B67B|nr:sigma-70 family RNA polymerase sigma factor [Nocardiopsis ansamitocini]